MIERDIKMLRGLFAHSETEQAIKSLMFEVMKDTNVTAKDLFYALENMKNVILDIKPDKKTKSLM